ncbi:hypothetical protein JHK86_004726 [Glycine max]|nr:hypothetical protein JHK86_004726 [Glycine max]
MWLMMEKHKKALLKAFEKVKAGRGSSLKPLVVMNSCLSGGAKSRHQPLLSGNGLHQLHILIFFLAVLHVFYSVVTMLLGRLKIRGWKAWEAETSSHGYEFANGMMSDDVHLAPGSKFNFQKYIKRSLEDDFKLELLLVVEKLQELRSIRIQKLKKQDGRATNVERHGCFNDAGYNDA